MCGWGWVGVLVGVGRRVDELVVECVCFCLFDKLFANSLLQLAALKILFVNKSFGVSFAFWMLPG